jgi:hypothetical protein
VVVNAFRTAKRKCANVPLDVSRIGTYCCEKTFSALGGMVGNQRVYTFLGGLRGLRKSIRATECASFGNVLLPSHDKPLTAAWEEEGQVEWDPLGYLTDHQIGQAWEKGVQDAADCIALFGMNVPGSPLQDVLRKVSTDDDDEDNWDEDCDVEEGDHGSPNFAQKLRDWICTPANRRAVDFGKLFNGLLGLQLVYHVLSYDNATSTFSSSKVPPSQSNVIIGHFPGTHKYILLEKCTNRTPKMKCEHGCWSGVTRVQFAAGLVNMKVFDHGSSPFEEDKKNSNLQSILQALNVDVSYVVGDCSVWMVPLVGILRKHMDCTSIVRRLTTMADWELVAEEEVDAATHELETDHKKHSPYVVAPGNKRIHKAELVASCNNTTPVSVDRVIRQQTSQPADEVDDEWGCGLLRNIAVKFEDENGTHTAWIGRIIRITKTVGTRCIDLVRAVDLSNRDENIAFQCCWYEPVKGQKHLYKYGLVDPMLVSISAVICPVHVSKNDSGFYVLDPPEQHEILDKALAGATEY